MTWKFIENKAEFPAEHCLAIVEEVLSHLKNSSQMTAFKGALNKAVQVRGFREPLKAPVKQARMNVAELTYRSPEFLALLLSDWIALHDELGERVLAGLPNPYDSETESLTIDEVHAEIEEFCAQNGDVPRPHATLMFYLLALDSPFRAKRNRVELTEDETPAVWGPWLQDLQSLQVDSPEWNRLPEFVARLQTLIEDNQAQRNAVRGQLQEALETLSRDAHAVLEYLEWSEDVQVWSPDAVSLADASRLTDSVSNLHAQLTEFWNLRNEQESTLKADRERRDRLDDLYVEFNSLYSSVRNAFAPSPSPDLAPRPEDGFHQLVSNDPPAKLESKSSPSVPGIQKPVGAVQPETSATTDDATKSKDVEEAETISDEPAQPDEEPARVAQNTPIPQAELGKTQDIARMLAKQDDDEHWNGLLWALVAEDDLPAAYWLICSRTAAGHAQAMPAELLAAAQGADWLLDAPGKFEDDLLAIVERVDPGADDSHQLLTLAASLGPALFAPHSGMHPWLQVPSTCPELNELVKTVGQFGPRGIAVQEDDLHGNEGLEKLTVQLFDLSAKAQETLDSKQMQRLQIKRTTDVWRRLLSPSGSLHTLLDPVAQDRCGDLETLDRLLTRSKHKTYLAELIDSTDNELTDGKARSDPIVGRARNQLERRIQDACAIAWQWSELTKQMQTRTKRRGWVSSQVETLRQVTVETLPAATRRLQELHQERCPADLAAAAFCLERALARLVWKLRLDLESPQPVEPNGNCTLAAAADSLQFALGHRLLQLPNLELTSELQPRQPDAIAEDLRSALADPVSPAEICKAWCDRQDYRFVDRLADWLPSTEEKTVFELDWQKAQEGSRDALRSAMKQAGEVVEEAVQDGIIGDEEHAQDSAYLERLDIESVVEFAPEFQRVRNIHVSVSDARQERRNELEQSWKDLASRLPSSHLAMQQEDIKKRIDNELRVHGTRVLEERIAYLRECLDNGQDLDESWHRPPQSERIHDLNRFQDWKPKLTKLMEQKKSLLAIVRDMEHRRSSGPISYAHLPQARLDEAIKAIKAWRSLKQKAGKHPSPRTVETVLSFLGFELSGTHAVKFSEQGDNWLYARAHMRALETLVKPIPQFGSQAQGLYHVVCLWQQPGADSIAARLRDLQLSARHVLILYLGRLSKVHLRDVSQVCREQELALAVLDESLLLFLAQERDSRLPVFLRCALPYTSLNPYTPFQAGAIPPEMFFGREEMVRDLQNMSGSCLVYGGRQLGKSALLAHVVRRFHDPDKESYAWIEDLKTTFDPNAGRGATHFWQTLRENFQNRGLLRQTLTTNSPRGLTDHIRQALHAVPHRQVLVMFDESDEFLDFDAQDQFRTVLALRDLMTSTDRRFKVVFAGLHNVQRFDGIPNQPLAHFGSSLCVGPLKANAALDLVQIPLETLGFRFSNSSDALQVLSYTNYHPGLIQLFCQSLLVHFKKRRSNHSLPCQITQEDIKSVYRDRNVRDKIRERFNWTLALDSRYQAIVWSMLLKFDEHSAALDQQALTTREILGEARYWLGSEFDKMSFDQMQSLLMELCGLGVLVRNHEEGLYRLRSPNLIPLMGSRSDIESRLLELAERGVPPSFDADSHHVLLDRAAQTYSPLTHGQERTLTLQKFGFGMVCASEALGLSRLGDDFFDRFVQTSEDQAEQIVHAPTGWTDGAAFGDWLTDLVQSRKGQDDLIVCCRIAGRDSLVEIVERAISFCRRHRPRRHSRRLNLCFVLDPAATWMWFSLSGADRDRLEKLSNAVVFPRCWNINGIRQRLSQLGKMNTDQVCQTVWQQTGGWPILLDELFVRCGRDDPRDDAQNIWSELAHPESTLRERFVSNLGADVDESVAHVMQSVAAGVVKTEDDIASMARHNGSANPDIYRNAMEYLCQFECLSKNSTTGSLELSPIVARALTPS